MDGSGGFGLIQIVLLGGGLCGLLLALVIGLAIFVKVIGVIRSLVGKLAVVGCYLIVLFGCCLLLLGGVWAVPMLLGGG